MSNFQRILIIVFLCIAVILVSGILLPKYLSSQILELRKEINSQSNNSKYSLQANLVPVAEKYTKNGSKNSILSRNIEAKNILISNFSQSSAKVKKRSKRQALSADEHFMWNFNFNLTGMRKHALESPTSASNTSNERKHLSISVITEGEGKKKTAFTDIQHSLKAVEYFFNYFFNAEKLMLDEETKSQLENTEVNNTQLSDESGDEPLMKGREGKFFDLGSLNIFGFRRSPEKSLSSTTVSTVAETDSVLKKEDGITTQSLQIATFTEEMQNNQSLDIQAQSLVSEVMKLENTNNITESILPGKTEDGECVDCAVGLESPIIGNNVEQINISETVTSSTAFTNEFLELFCMSLVNKVGVSQHLTDSENSNPEMKQNVVDHKLKSPDSPTLDLLSDPEKGLNQDFSDTFIFENETRQKKFLNFGSLFGFGSGRAAADQDELEDLSPEGFDDAVNLNNLPTLVDCENYFRKKSIKMFPKPNLMDIISDPKIQFADFANATISPKLREHQLQFLTGLLKNNLDKNFEIFGKNSDSAVTKFVSDEETLENGFIQNEISQETSVNTVLNDNIGIIDAFSDITTFMSTDDSEVEQTTELPRDGRFISIFGFGSGNGEFRSLGSDIFNTDEIDLLGSGKLESKEVVGFGIDENEFESGSSLRSKEAAKPGTVRKKQLENEDSRSIWAALLGTNNELASGDLRSFDTSTFGINKGEFGNGDLRSFWSTLFGIDRNELGSGDLRSFDVSTSRLEINDLGNGDMISGFESNEFESNKSRSLDTKISDTEKTEFGSGDLRPFWSLFGTDGNELGSGDPRSLESTFGTEINDLGSGDIKSSSENTTFRVERNEFVSNESRSLDTISDVENSEFGSGGMRSLDTISDTENSEFGSGEMRSFDSADSNTERNELGSGEMRSLDSTDSDTERNEFGIGDLFKETDLHGKLRSVLKNKEKFGIISSNENKHCLNCDLGNLRETNISTTVGNETFSKCDQCISNITNYESQEVIHTEEIAVIDTKYGIRDGNHETTGNADISDGFTNKGIYSVTDSVIKATLEQNVDKNIQRILGPIFLTGSGDGGLFGDSGGPIIFLEEEDSISVNTENGRINEERNASGKKNEIEESHEQNTEISTQKFLGTISLTGDKGLIVDSEGPINVLKGRNSTAKSQTVSLRRARLDDVPLNFPELFSESGKIQSAQDSPASTTTKISSTSPVLPARRGRLDDTMDNYEDFDGNYRKKLNPQDFANPNISQFKKRIDTQTDKEILTNQINVTVLPDGIRSSIPTFHDVTIKYLLKPRPCIAARECNVTLNERCVTINSSRVCGCSKGYARNKKFHKCIVKKIVETSIRLPAETFDEDLKNPFSPGFQKKRKSTVEMMMLLLQNDPELLRVLTEINVIGFSAGSLVVKLNLIFAAENKSELQLVSRVEDDLQVALRNDTFIRNVPLNISEASLISVNGEIDYCKSSELNYCSEHAYCVSNSALPASYACHCKEHYRDVSSDPRHIGEACLEKCPKEYCGTYGHCELLSNDERICLCSGLYFGRRCEVPGLYVLIVLGFVGFLSLTMLFVVIFKRRCSRFSYRDSQAGGNEENETHSHINCKVSDAIALEENIGTTRFVNISTPVPHPIINIIRPTVTESGSSYDFDSTFDSTPSVHKNDENSTV